MITCIYSSEFARNRIRAGSYQVDVTFDAWERRIEIRDAFQDLKQHFQPTDFPNRTTCISNSETLRIFFRLRDLILADARRGRGQVRHIMEGSVLA